MPCDVMRCDGKRRRSLSRSYTLGAVVHESVKIFSRLLLQAMMATIALESRWQCVLFVRLKGGAGAGGAGWMHS